MEKTMKDYRSMETSHNGRVSVGVFPNGTVLGMVTLGCTVDMHLTLEEAEKLTTMLVELLGSCKETNNG